MGEDGKGIVVVTGASSGIGKACALLFARSGYRVFAGVRNADIFCPEEAGPSFVPLELDVTRPEEIETAFQEVSRSLRPDEGVAGLVNNAGIVVSGPLECLPVQSLRQQFEVDVLGHMAVTRAFIPLLRKAGGRILNIGTAGWRLDPPFLGPYISAKHALEGLTHALRRELQPLGIHVVMIVPGPVRTPFWEKAYALSYSLEKSFRPECRRLYADRYNKGRVAIDRMRRRALPAEAAARVVKAALESRRPKLRYYVGHTAVAGAIAAGLIPQRLNDWLTEKVLSL
jgi:NAD(P)-dependent dehydrogenase (short-subunit alcohol dehydrogenase family)